LTTVPCPNRGQEVFDYAEQCPACGHWIVHDGGAMSGRPPWFVAIGFAGALLAILVWLIWR
jgi:hypothetical protein